MIKCFKNIKVEYMSTNVVASFEQDRFYDLDLDDFRGYVLIDANAGCGKTHTVVEKVKQNPHKKFLLLAFSSDAKKELQKRLKSSDNCEIYSMHGLAYKYFGKRYSKRISNKALSVRELLENGFADEIKRENCWAYDEADLMLRLFRSYLKNHLSIFESVYRDFSNSKIRDRARSIDRDADFFIKKISILKREILRDDSNLSFEHDLYLKLFFEADIEFDYDTIIVDEAQDVNELMFNLVVGLNEKGVIDNSIWVGDVNQNIFGFNNTINALSMLKGKSMSKMFFLSESFRCPNSVIESVEPYLEILGKAKGSFRGVDREYGDEDISEIAVIGRGYSSILMFARKKILENSNVKFHFLGGLNKWKLNDCKSIVALMSRSKNGYKKIHNPFFDSFNDYRSLLDYIKNTNDKTLDGKCSIVKRLMSVDELGLFELLDELKEREVSERAADFILSTAHRSKGLEWDKCFVLDDFINIKKLNKEVMDGKVDPLVDPIELESVRLLYVAMTRAKKILSIPQDYELGDSDVESVKSIFNL